MCEKLSGVTIFLFFIIFLLVFHIFTCLFSKDIHSLTAQLIQQIYIYRKIIFTQSSSKKKAYIFLQMLCAELPIAGHQQ
jgi:hypothetical protein